MPPNGVIKLSESSNGASQRIKSTNADHGDGHGSVDTERDLRAPRSHYYCLFGGRQHGADGERSVLIDGLRDDRVAESVSLIEDGEGRLLDNHHPAISADGRFVAYLETLVDAGEGGCQVHLYDRDSTWYRRTPCPEALAEAAANAWPHFSADARQVIWHLPSVDEPVVIDNPGVDQPPRAAP
jgi:hypothetical protein